VTRCFKFVAIIVAFVLMAGSVSVFANCLYRDSGTAAMPMHCCPHCPMIMAHHTESGNQLKAVAQRGSCCDLSSGKPVPASVPLPANSSSHAGIVTLKATPATPCPNQPEKRLDPVPIPPDVSPQAALCTFLI
jgi:hypothetical protein